MASDASRISSSAGIASARSIFAAGFFHQLARPADVVARAREGNAQEVRLDLRRDFDVAHVLVGERGRGESAPLAIDALVVRQRTAFLHGGVDARTAHFGNQQHDATVVEQQRVTRHHVIGQIAVIETDAMRITQRALGVEHESRALLQRDGAMRELADADFRALQIHQHADRAAHLACEFAHEIDALAMLVGGAVREIDADHVEAGADHRLQRPRIARRRPQRGDDFGAAEHAASPEMKTGAVSRPFMTA
jgi:hypothetical protein